MRDGPQGLGFEGVGRGLLCLVDADSRGGIHHRSRKRLAVSDHPHVKETLPCILCAPPLAQLCAIPSHSGIGDPGAEPSTSLCVPLLRRSREPWGHVSPPFVQAGQPNVLRLCAQDVPSSPLTSCAVLLWMLARSLTCLCYYGAQDGTQYSWCGPSGPKQSGKITSFCHLSVL